jgi:hypothetical protein
MEYSICTSTAYKTPGAGIVCIVTGGIRLSGIRNFEYCDAGKSE